MEKERKIHKKTIKDIIEELKRDYMELLYLRIAVIRPKRMFHSCHLYYKELVH